MENLAGVQILIHLEGAVDPLAVHVFRIKGTPRILVLNSVIGAIIATTMNVKGEMGCYIYSQMRHKTSQCPHN